MDTKALKGIAVRADFSSDDLELLERVDQDGDGPAYLRTLTLIYTSRLLKDAVDSHRAATFQLAQETARHSSRLIWFSVALVVLAAALAGLALRGG